MFTKSSQDDETCVFEVSNTIDCVRIYWPTQNRWWDAYFKVIYNTSSFICKEHDCEIQTTGTTNLKIYQIAKQILTGDVLDIDLDYFEKGYNGRVHVHLSITRKDRSDLKVIICGINVFLMGK